MTRSHRRVRAILALLPVGRLLLHSVAHAGQLLADPAAMLKTAERMDFKGHNDFAVEQGPDGRMLRSTPHGSASGLYQRVTINGTSLTHVRWRWRVDHLAAAADLRVLAKEDTGATVFFVFGEPSWLNRDVPTLAYTWSATPVADGTIVRSRRFNSLAYVQLHGAAAVGTWQDDTRDVAADYRRIFKTEPGPLDFIAVFNDNDQTGEATSALFGPVTDAR